MSGNQFYGWFDDAAQTAPTYDPPHDGPCLYCGLAISADDVRTHSIMMAANDYAKRSYFYRTHKTCAQAFASAIGDNFIFEMIARNGD